MRPLNDHELLIQIANDVRDLKHVIEGNGQPGVSHRLTALETRVDERTSPSKSAVMGLSGGTAVALTLIAEWLKAKLGAQ